MQYTKKYIKQAPKSIKYLLKTGPKWCRKGVKRVTIHPKGPQRAKVLNKSALTQCSSPFFEENGPPRGPNSDPNRPRRGSKRGSENRAGFGAHFGRLGGRLGGHLGGHLGASSGPKSGPKIDRFLDRNLGATLAEKGRQKIGERPGSPDFLITASKILPTIRTTKTIISQLQQQC